MAVRRTRRWRCMGMLRMARDVDRNKRCFCIIVASAVAVTTILVLLDTPSPQPMEQERTYLPTELKKHPSHLNVGQDGFRKMESSYVDICPADLDPMTGRVNYDSWNNIVGYTVDDMRIKYEFPSRPDERRTIGTLRAKFNQVAVLSIGGKYGHKMYGYLHPPSTGEYAFQLITHDTQTAKCSAELWVSLDANPFNMRRLLRIDPPENKQLRISLTGQAVSTHGKGTRLVSGSSYYFEFLMQAFNGHVDLEVQWKLVGHWDDFRTIPPSCLSKFIHWPNRAHRSAMEILKDPVLPSNQLQEYHYTQFVGDTVYPITDLDVLPKCQFKAEYAYERTLKEYRGVKETFLSKIFPNMEDSGNPRLEEKAAANILKLYNKAIGRSKKLSGVVQGIRYMDETENRNMGSRFLLELDIKLDGQEKIIHTSEYVYLPKRTDKLCHTENFQWKKNVDVYLVVSLKNLWAWVIHLIHNMERIYEETQDEHFHLIVVDFDSMDIDVEEELRRSSFKRWTVIRVSEPFSRSKGLQIAVDHVTDPDSIVMTIDMHLTLPPGFVEFTRRHCVQGKMGFAPMFFRLMEGFTELQRTTDDIGFWEVFTYGIFAMYKSDWVKTGGFDTQKYTTKWGGEDMALLDSTLSKGLEVFRVGYPGLVHYHHTKAGMWNKNPHFILR